MKTKQGEVLVVVVAGAETWRDAPLVAIGDTILDEDVGDYRRLTLPETPVAWSAVPQEGICMVEGVLRKRHENRAYSLGNAVHPFAPVDPLDVLIPDEGQMVKLLRKVRPSRLYDAPAIKRLPRQLVMKAILEQPRDER